MHTLVVLVVTAFYCSFSFLCVCVCVFICGCVGVCITYVCMFVCAFVCVTGVMFAAASSALGSKI